MGEATVISSASASTASLCHFHSHFNLLPGGGHALHLLEHLLGFCTVQIAVLVVIVQVKGKGKLFLGRSLAHHAQIGGQLLEANGAAVVRVHLGEEVLVTSLVHRDT